MKLTNSIPELLPMDGRRIKVYYRGIQKLCTKCFGEHMSRNCNEEKVKWLDYVDNFMQTHSEIQEDLYGNWNNIIERERRQKKINREHYESKQHQPCLEEQANDQHLQSTESTEQITEPVQIGSQSQAHQKQPEFDSQNDQSSNQQDQTEEPRASDYKIPETDEAMADMIDKLMDLGLSHNDATASIEKRRKAYEKAMKKYMQQKSKKTKQTKPRKESQNEK